MRGYSGADGDGGLDHHPDNSQVFKQERLPHPLVAAAVYRGGLGHALRHELITTREALCAPPLNNVIRFERADNGLVHFDLNCRVTDAETLVQLMREPNEKFVTRMSAWHQTMTA